MPDKEPKPQGNKNDNSNDSLKSLSEAGKKRQQILDQLSINHSLKLGIPSEVFRKIKQINSPLSGLSDIALQFKNLNPLASQLKEINDIAKNVKNVYEPFKALESFNKTSDILNSILGIDHPFLGRQTQIFNSINTYLNSDFEHLFSKKNPELFPTSVDWKDLLSKEILGSTVLSFNQPGLQIEDLEDKIENTLNEEETLLENKEFTNEIREKFDNEFVSSYKLAEWIEKESTFLLYRLMSKYGISVQAARNIVTVLIWSFTLYIGVLAKELMTPKKENRKYNITHNHTHKTINNYFTIKGTDTVVAKTPVYRRSSDKTKRHETIPKDSIVSVFKQKGKYSLVETAIDSTAANERRIVRGWIKSDSLETNSFK